MSVVLDAGALIALEANDRTLWAVLRLAAQSGEEVVVPSTVVAQVWRGERKQAQLGRALSHCAIAPFDALARVVGELCGKARTRDICDAHVAIIAAWRGRVLYTSDPSDLKRLLMAHGKRQPVVVRC
jgi:predicted nucleic acid-binding protein